MATARSTTIIAKENIVPRKSSTRLKDKFTKSLDHKKCWASIRRALGENRENSKPWLRAFSLKLYLLDYTEDKILEMGGYTSAQINNIGNRLLEDPDWNFQRKRGTGHPSAFSGKEEEWLANYVHRHPKSETDSDTAYCKSVADAFNKQHNRTISRTPVKNWLKRFSEGQNLNI